MSLAFCIRLYVQKRFEMKTFAYIIDSIGSFLIWSSKYVQILADYLKSFRD